MVSVSFYDDIILLACVKWVKTLKWQQRMEGNVRSNCRDTEIKKLRSPHSVQRSSSASPALCRPPPTAVWELDHWWTLRSALCLWMTSLRAVHVEFPHLPLPPTWDSARRMAQVPNVPSKTFCPFSAFVRFGGMGTVAVTLSNNLTAGSRTSSSSLPWTVSWLGFTSLRQTVV